MTVSVLGCGFLNFTLQLFCSIFKIREHGIQDRLNHKIYPKRPLCEGSSQNFDSVRLSDFYPALLVFLYGVLLSIFFLVVERFIANREKEKLIIIRRDSEPLGALIDSPE